MPLKKFETNKKFRTLVLKLEGIIDASIIGAATNPNSISIEAPMSLTTEAFEVLWKRYTDVGWTTFAWNKQTNKLLIQKRT
jgi:hypothetical protein